MSWCDDFNAEKRMRGMAAYGTARYWRNAASILSHCPDRPDTRTKMGALSQSRDPQTRAVAQSWLCTHSAWED